MWMNSQGEGSGPTGTSIRVGPSRRAKARRSAARSSCGVRARSAGGAEAFGESDEIGIGEVAGDQPVAEALLLDAPHIAEGAVGEHDGDERDAVAHRGRHLVAGEHEAAVAADRHHRHVAAARAARRARWQSPSRDCPDSRARGTCAACRPGRRGGRQSRSASPRRRRCRPPAVRRGSRRGRRAAARSCCRRCAPFRLALLHLGLGARRACGLCAGSASSSRRRIGLASPISATAGLCSRAGSSGSASTRMICRSSSTPHCVSWMSMRVPTASTTSASPHSSRPSGSVTLSGSRPSSTPRPRR